MQWFLFSYLVLIVGFFAVELEAKYAKRIFLIHSFVAPLHFPDFHTRFRLAVNFEDRDRTCSKKVSEEQRKALQIQCAPLLLRVRALSNKSDISWFRTQLSLISPTLSAVSTYPKSKTTSERSRNTHRWVVFACWKARKHTFVAFLSDYWIPNAISTVARRSCISTEGGWNAVGSRSCSTRWERYSWNGDALSTLSRSELGTF